MADKMIEDFLTGQKFPDTDMERLRQKVARFLVEKKGYAKEDIESRRQFQIKTETRIVNLNIDFIINLNQKRVFLIQCYPTALITREKFTLACARLIERYQIPFVAITDGFETEVFDVLTGKSLGNRLESIPPKSVLQRLFPELKFIPLEQGRVIKEKRILAAFDLLRCPGTCQICPMDPSACV